MKNPVLWKQLPTNQNRPDFLHSGCVYHCIIKGNEDREYRPLEAIKDNYPKYVVTADSILQQRNGIEHINLVDFMRNGKAF